MSHKYYHKNKEYCILMGIKNFAKKLDFTAFYVRIKLTKKQRNSKFSWALEQNVKCYFLSDFSNEWL